MTKSQIKNLVIAILVALASVLGYKLSIQPETTTTTTTTVTVDSSFVDTSKTN